MQTAYANRNTADSSANLNTNDYGSANNSCAWCKIGRVVTVYAYFTWTNADITLSSSVPTPLSYTCLNQWCYDNSDGGCKIGGFVINGTTLKVWKWGGYTLTNNHEYSAVITYLSKS